MDLLNAMFLGSQGPLEGTAVDEKVFSLLDGRGNLVRVSALDKSWPLLSLNSHYARYPVSPGQNGQGKGQGENLILWRRARQSYVDELSNLVLQTPYTAFWRQVLHQPGKVLRFLRSYSSGASRNYDLEEMSPEDQQVNQRLYILSFIAFLTIAHHSRQQGEHISEKKHAEILQKFLKLPYLLDICALYGGNAQLQPLLQPALSACFQKHRRLYTELRIALRDISETLMQPLEERLSHPDMDLSSQPTSQLGLKDLLDVVGYVCDILTTLNRLVRAGTPDIVALVRDAKFASRLAEFAEKVVCQLSREVTIRLEKPELLDGPADPPGLRHAGQQANLMEMALVDTFRRLDCPAFYAEGPPSGTEVAASLTTLLETLPHFQLFTIMYETWHPIRRDIDLAKQSKANVEESVVDFLAHAVKEAFQSQNLTWDYASSGLEEPQSRAVVDVAPKATVAARVENSSAESDQINRVTGQILEMLDGMGLDSDYVKACVAHYKCDLNATADAILSGSVPIEISNSTSVGGVTAVEAPVQSKPAPVPASKVPTGAAAVSRPIPTKAVAHTAPGTVIEKVYYGKRDLYEETEEESISDATRLVTIARVQQMYEDEYDDTYDEFEAEGAGGELNAATDATARDLLTMAQEDKAKPSTFGKNDSAAAPSGRAQGSQQRHAPGGHSMASQPNRGPAQPGTSNRMDGNEKSGRPDLEEPPPVRSSDPWTRQMEDNYAAQVARRPPGTTKTAGASGDERSRANKEKNKAHAANHNRKDRGQWKRNQGMF